MPDFNADRPGLHRPLATHAWRSVSAPPGTAGVRRIRGGLAGVLVALALAGCAGTSPPVQLYRLPLQPPVPLQAVAAPVTPAVPFVLLSPVTLPDYLDRDALVAPIGAAGLQVLVGQRWAEPLRESVPRLLRLDLATLLGDAAVQGGPLPAGTGPGRALKVELLALEPAADRSAVTLVARWEWRARAGEVGAAGRAEGGLPGTGTARLMAPVRGAGMDAVVLAHRAALAQLATEIARSLQPGR